MAVSSSRDGARVGGAPRGNVSLSSTQAAQDGTEGCIVLLGPRKATPARRACAPPLAPPFCSASVVYERTGLGVVGAPRCKARLALGAACGRRRDRPPLLE